MPQETRTTAKSCRNLTISALRMMLPEMSKHRKFSNFFEFAKDKNKRTKILKQDKETTLT
jgi:hypothetical protein